MIKKISVLLIAALSVFVFLNTSTTVYAAASDIEGPSTIHKEANQVFTVGDLLSMYEMDVFIKDDYYTGYGNVPGEYLITLTQGSNTKDVRIVVVEDWGMLAESNDVLYVTDSKNIYVSNDRVLTLYEIIYYIYDVCGFVNTEYQFRYEELQNEYHSSIDEETGLVPEGEYDFHFRLTYYTGEQVTHSTVITSVELPELPGVVLEAPPTAVEQLMGAIPWVIGFIVVIYLWRNRKKKGSYNSW